MLKATGKRASGEYFPKLRLACAAFFCYALSKWFAQASGYRNSIGHPRDLKLHGLRLTIITKMVHANERRGIINQVVGHSGEGIGEKVYTNDRELPDIKLTIEKIKYPGLDLGRLRKLAEEAAE
jgi:hypothetical protein